MTVGASEALSFLPGRWWCVSGWVFPCPPPSRGSFPCPARGRPVCCPGLREGATALPSLAHFPLVSLAQLSAPCLTSRGGLSPKYSSEVGRG